MVLLINTTDDTGVTGQLRELLEKTGTNFEIVQTAGMKISPCMGCNHCWLRTPGICSIRDDYETVLKRIIGAGQMWVITDTALGFMDHKGKNIFDRILPITTMYLHFRNGQMRHVPRYPVLPDVGIIFRGEADRAYLERWTERAALNFERKALGVFRSDEIREAVACMR